MKKLKVLGIVIVGIVVSLFLLGALTVYLAEYSLETHTTVYKGDTDDVVQIVEKYFPIELPESTQRLNIYQQAFEGRIFVLFEFDEDDMENFLITSEVDWGEVPQSLGSFPNEFEF